MQTQFFEETPARLICAILLTPFFVLGLIFLLLWLGLHPHEPRFHIQEFSVPGLDKPNGFENTNITFNLTARNPNRRVWIHYESIDGSVYYKDQQVGSVPIENSFNQEPKNTTTLQQTLSGTMTTSTVNNQSWTGLMNDRVQGTVVFSLRLTSIIKYKKTMWDLRHHRMHANCDVGVSSDGLILSSYKNKGCIVQ